MGGEVNNTDESETESAGGETQRDDRGLELDCSAKEAASKWTEREASKQEAALKVKKSRNKKRVRRKLTETIEI